MEKQFMPTRKMVTVVIKSFLRPQCLYACYKSIRMFYPDIPIVIVDDSGYWNEIFEEISNDDNVDFVQIEFDSGLSKGRNVGVSRVKTEFFVLCDDDFIFIEDTKIEDLIKPLSKYDICGGLVASPHEYGFVQRWTGKFSFDDKYIRLEQGSKDPIYFDDVVVYDTDLTLNFFAARTSVIQKHPWDDSFKVSREHLDSFLNWYFAGVKCCWTPNVICGHIKSKPSDYFQYRDRPYHDTFINKWGKDSKVKSFINMPMIYQNPDDIINKIFPHNNKNNIIITGTGRSGTTIVTKMLGKMGWNLGNVDDKYYEHQEILNLCNEPLDKNKAKKVIDGLKKPWVIKQPRFCDNWDEWKEVINCNENSLIIIERNTDDVLASLYKAGWNLDTEEATRNFVLNRKRNSRTIFEEWNGFKLIINYEDLKQAINLWEG